MAVFPPGGVVAVHEGGGVGVVDDQVQVAVVIQVGVGRAIGEAVQVQSPLFGDLAEGVVALRPAILEGGIRDGVRGNGVDQHLKVYAPTGGHLALELVVGDVVQKVAVGQVLVDAISHVEVLVAVVVHVEDERPPAPVGGLHPAEPTYLREGAVAIVALQHVAGELVVVVVLQVELVAVPVFEGGRFLQPLVGGRQHLGHEELREAIVVDVGHVRPHAGGTDALHGLGQRLAEGAVPLVDVEVIALEKVVAHEDVRPAIAVHVPHGHPQPEADDGAVNTGLLTDIVVVVVPVLVKPVATHRIALGPFVLLQVEGADGLVAVVEQVEVEVAVTVVVEEHAVGAKALISKTVVGSGFGKGTVLLVDVQFVAAVVTLDITGVADVDVEPAVRIDVGHRHAGTPGGLSRYAGPLGHVLELHVPPVEEEAVIYPVTAQVDVGQSVVVDVTQGHAAAVVEVAVGVDVEVLVEVERIGEVDPGDGGRQGLEAGLPVPLRRVVGYRAVVTAP